MTLTKGTIEEAMGRAALVYELNAVEARMQGLGPTLKHLRGQVEVARDQRRPDEQSDLEGKAAECDEMLQQLSARREAILSLLWHPDADAEPPPNWEDKVRNAPREELLRAVENVLRRRPEVTPPEGFEDWAPRPLRDWLLCKIGELPEEERDAWIR